jgi:hypothetical protein
MRRDEILKMQAGREMDALIAREVMAFDYDFIKSRNECRFIDQEGNTYRAEDLPRFTEDIAAAWQAVAKMREKGFDFFAEWVTENAVSRLNSLPWACFAPDDNDGDFADFTATAETMPLAICRAALLAVMECDE